MTGNERIQSDVQQAKDQVSQLRDDAGRKVAEAKTAFEIEREKARLAIKLDNEAAKDEAVFRAVNADAKGFVETEAAKDAAEFNATSADLKAKHEKLQARRAQLKNEISAKAGEARAKLQADLDRVAKEIADSEAAMDAYYARRDETGMI